MEGKIMRNLLFVVLVLSFIFSMNFVQAQTTSNDQDKRLEALEKVCQQQEEQIKKLQKRLGILETDESYKDYTQKIVKEYLKQPETQDNTAGIAAGYENGFFIRSGDGKYKLNMTGYVQMGLGIFENDTFDNNTFYPNGVYLTFDVYLLKDVHGRIQVDFWQGANLRDAFVEYMPMPEFNLRVGQTHVPFTMGGQYGETEGITIWGAPFLSWAHGRDPGLMIHGLVSDMMEYKVSIHNGNGEDTLNATDDFLVAAQTRIYFMGHEKNPNTFLHIGAIRGRDSRTVDNGINNGTALVPATKNNPINSATIYRPWEGIGNNAGGLVANGEESTRGWKTGANAGLRFDKDLDGGSNIRVENEFMYMLWERDLTAANGGRLPHLEGWGYSFAIVYRHCMNPEVAGSGIFPAFAFSYTDMDNRSTDNTPVGGNILGQRVFTYTLGLGYAFNKHMAVNFNWIIMDVENLNVNGAKSNPKDASDDVEHAWFLQFTAQW